MYTKTRLKEGWAESIKPIFAVFNNLQLKPIHITLTGSFLIMSGCLFLLNEQKTLAFFSLLIGGLCDALDGAYARITHQVSQFGGYFDSVIDRYNEFILVGCVFYLYRDNELLYYFSFLVFLGICMMSYTRALFEKNGFVCPENPFEYLERGITFLIFFLFNRLDLWLIIIAMGTQFFVFRRGYQFYQLTKKHE